MKEIRLVVHKDFKVPEGLEDPSYVERVLSAGVKVIQESRKNISIDNKSFLNKIVDIFPTTMIEIITERTSVILIEGIKILITFNSENYITEKILNQFYEEVDEYKVCTALFVSPNSLRLINGHPIIYFETHGINKVPIVYLGKRCINSQLALQLVLLLLQHIARNNRRIASSQKTPKKTKDEIISWLQKYGSENMTAEELRMQMGISIRNVNDLGGINILKDEAFGCKTTRRGRKCNITQVITA